MAGLYSLTVYVDTKLLEDSTQLGNLCFSKLVGKDYNVVFQSRGDLDILTFRNIIEWRDSYKMGAVQSPRSGARIKGATSLRDIQGGQVCQWGPTSGDMPIASPAPPQWGWGNELFGTSGMPPVFQGAVWASTGGSAYSCIYVDTTVHPGLDRISYLPKNNFQIFWDFELTSMTLYTQKVSRVYDFAIPPGQNNRYLRWGYANPNTPSGPRDIPVWTDYGITDPFSNGMNARSVQASIERPLITAGFDYYPDGSDSTMTPSFLAATRTAIDTYSYDGAPYLVTFKLSWDRRRGGPDDDREDIARKVGQYLALSVDPSLNIEFQTLASFLIASVQLKARNPAWDIVNGDNDAERCKLVIVNLLQNLSPKYQPSSQEWTTGGDVPADADWSAGRTHENGVGNGYVNGNSKYNDAEWTSTDQQAPSLAKWAAKAQMQSMLCDDSRVQGEDNPYIDGATYNKGVARLKELGLESTARGTDLYVYFKNDNDLWGPDGCSHLHIWGRWGRGDSWQPLGATMTIRRWGSDPPGKFIHVQVHPSATFATYMTQEKFDVVDEWYKSQGDDRWGREWNKLTGAEKKTYFDRWQTVMAGANAMCETWFGAKEWDLQAPN